LHFSWLSVSIPSTEPIFVLDEVATEPVVGDLFALISDDVWCRVKVTGANGEKIHVFFVDHGDETETTKAELRPLASQFRQLPFQVRLVSKIIVLTKENFFGVFFKFLKTDSGGAQDHKRCDHRIKGEPFEKNSQTFRNMFL
jgi:hypothetical protein